MTTNAASPAHYERAAQNQQPQGEAAPLGEDWQRQIEEMLQPAFASLQQQVMQAAEQQLDPLRARIQQVAEQQEPSDQPALSSDVEGRAGEGTQQQGTSGLRSLVQTPTTQPSVEGGSALQRWGETLEGAAVIVLALGEVLEGLALLLQALGLVVGGKPSPQQEQDPSSQETQEGDTSEQEEHEEPSLAQKVGDTVSGGVSSLKQTVGQAVSRSPLSHQDGGPPALQQWGRILEHAASLMRALGDGSSSGQGGLSSLQRWGTIMKHATPLVKELNEVLGNGSSSRQGGGGMQRWGHVLERAASAVQALGGDGSSEQQEDGKASEQEGKGDSSSDQEEGDESSSKKGGGVSSALQALTGDSSSKDSSSEKSEKKEEGGGTSLIDALTGESSPLQTLREFSKRQQGPGGLAPKGPIGRKPPPGPLRRDRLPNAG